MPDKAGPLFLRAGQDAAAAQEMEKAGDFLGLSRCLSGMGRYFDAVRALEKTDMDPRRMTEELLRLLYLHFSADPVPDRKALEKLHAEAMHMKSDGRLAPALARFKLMEDDDNIKELHLRLGLHEEAIRYFTATSNAATALAYARSKGVAVSKAFIESFMQEHWTESRRGDEEKALLRELFFEMLDACFRDVPEPEPRRLLERFFAVAIGSSLNTDYLPDIVFDLVIRYRVPNLIITILRDNLEFKPSGLGRFRSFVDNLTRTAADTADRDLSACAAYAAGQQAFEKAIESLVLSDRNVVVIAMSRIRYRDAVAWLMAAGRIDQAELYCRINKDHGLAARYAEERGDLKPAARYFMEALDYEGALRCYRALKDQRGEARALERLGRIAEAIALWRKLGRRLDVSRLLKKHPRAGQDKK
jgi:tetratricopeptide (TPR) repeat protein